MGAELLKNVGQIAGIGGIALGVLLLVFRDVIRKKIFPMLTKEHAYRLLRLVLVLVWSVALAGIGAWAFVDRRIEPPDIIVPNEDVASSIDGWLKLVDDERYQEAWQSMPKFRRERFGKVAFIETFSVQRGTKGKIVSRVPHGSITSSSPPGLPPGAYETRSFITQFHDGTQAIEKVTAIGTDSGWKVVFHTIEPVVQ